MADLSDVETALVAALMAIAYPSGSSGASAFGAAAKVFRGQAAGSMLVADAAAGVVDIGVFPDPGRGRDTTRWGVQVTELGGSPGVTVVTDGNSATFYGSANRGDLAGVLVGATGYVYAAQTGDSASLVAACVAGAIRANTICWLTGATLTVPACTAIAARTGAAAQALEEWARQEHDFRISVWAGTPALRDAACGAVGAALATMTFLTLADGTGGRLRYSATASDDADQASSVYRRDLVYTVEYGTTVLMSGPRVLFGDINANGRTILV
jgi:hypothetical protein